MLILTIICVYIYFLYFINNWPKNISEPTSKYVWFYLPMTILLFINGFVFCVLSRLLCKLDRDKRHLGISKQNERSDIVEK